MPVKPGLSHLDQGMRMPSRADSYERCLDDYFTDLVDAHGGDASAVWSFDSVHLDHVGHRPGRGE